MHLAGKPVLEHVVERIQTCQYINNIVVATSADPSDDPIEEWCSQTTTAIYRGSLDDVLDRYVNAARMVKADAVVRITADCPAIDPAIVDEIVRDFFAGDFDSYGLAGEFPDGLDCTVYSREALEIACVEAKLLSEREHVGPYIEKHPEKFKTGGYYKFDGLGVGHHRWTLDEQKDYEFLSRLFALHRDTPDFGSQHIFDLLADHPELTSINASIPRNEGYTLSLLADDVK